MVAIMVLLCSLLLWEIVVDVVAEIAFPDGFLKPCLSLREDVEGIEVWERLANLVR